MALLRFLKKSGNKIKGIPVIRLLTAWCLTVDFLSPAVHPFNTLENTVKVRFPVFLLIFLLQILFLYLLHLPLKNKVPLPERVVLPAALGIYTFVTISQKKEFYYVLLLCCLWAILLQYYNRHGWLRFKKPFTKKKTVILITVSAILFFGIVGGSGVLRYLTFHCPNFDFGIFSQMFYNMKHSLQPLTTCERDRLLSHFAVHLSPILYLLLPVYSLFTSPITLQLAQAAILASAVIPLALLCRKFGLSYTRTAVMALILLCYPAVACGTNYDFHENCFLLPLLLWLFYAYETRRLWMMALFVALVLMVKEDAAIYIAFFALYVFLNGKRYLQGSLLFVGAGAYFLCAVLFLTVRGEGVMIGRYDNFIVGDGTLLQAIKNVLVNPGYALLQMLRDEDGDNMPKLLFLLQMAIPLAFIPFGVKCPAQLLLVLPMLLINFMTLYVYQYDIGFQYSFGSSAFLFYLSVINVGEMKPKTGRMLLSIAGVAGIMLFFSLPFSRFTGYVKDYRENIETYRAMEQALREIPSDGSVACTTMLLAHMSERDIIYETHYHKPAENEKLDYIILDARYDVDEPLENYQTLGYRIVRTVEHNGEKLLIILQ